MRQGTGYWVLMLLCFALPTGAAEMQSSCPFSEQVLLASTNPTAEVGFILPGESFSLSSTDECADLNEQMPACGYTWDPVGSCCVPSHWSCPQYPCF